MKSISTNLYDYFLTHGVNIVEAALLAFVGIGLARFLRSRLQRYLKKHTEDPTVKLFTLNLFSGVLLLIIIIIVLAELGVPTASLLTVLGAGSLAIGLAIKDSLSNIAGGLMLVFLQPFKIKDVVEIGGVLGTVVQIGLYTTQIKTANHEMIYIPNAKVMSEKIINKSIDGLRRLDLQLTLSYEVNLQRIRSLIVSVMQENQHVLTSPEPKVIVHSLSEKGIVLRLRPWVKRDDFTKTRYELLEAVRLVFDQNGIAIVPTPQMDINLRQNAGAHEP